MEIYIEIFILQNILINFCLLRLVYLTTKTKTTSFKMFLGSLIGTVPSIFIVMFLQNSLVLNSVKILTALLMLITAFTQTKKQFAFNLILLFLYTYTFGGLVMALSSNVYQTSFGAVMASKFSLELICLVFIIFTYIFELVTKQLKFKIKTNNLLYNVTLTQKNNTLKINAYMDTGNFIHHDNKPVLILDLQAYLKLTKTNLINFLTSKTEEIKTNTITGNNNLKLFQIDKLEFQIDKKLITINNAYVAINITNCFVNTNYQALLSPLFL